MNDNLLKVKLQMGILKPANEVFDAIVNPKRLSKYFTTTSSGRLEDGKSITWAWEDYNAEHEIKVQRVEQDKYISFKWNGSGSETLAEIFLDVINENHTLVKITESDFPADFKGAAKCMGQTEGWTHFLCCLKAYLEHSVDLRLGGVIR